MLITFFCYCYYCWGEREALPGEAGSKPSKREALPLQPSDIPSLLWGHQMTALARKCLCTSSEQELGELWTLKCSSPLCIHVENWQDLSSRKKKFSVCHRSIESFELSLFPNS